MNNCPYCQSDPNMFITLNDCTVLYSGIDIAMNKQGMLRIRRLDSSGNLITQEIVDINYCPICGRKF